MRTLDVDLLTLRNRLPQNVTNETTAREVAKDIVQNDIPMFSEYSECVQSGIKYLLIASLLEQAEKYSDTDRTLGKLFLQIRKQKGLPESESGETYVDMLSMLPKDDLTVAKFHICDKLMKYQAFDKMLA